MPWFYERDTIVLRSEPPVADPNAPAGRLKALTRHREALFLAGAVAAVFVTRVGYLPTTLEDIDSVNFDRGVHFFYPFADQPHPPGYAVFIAVAKLVHPLFSSHAAGLAFPSVVFSAMALIPLYKLFCLLFGDPQAALACVLVLFNPVFWINSVRPMSDITGFAAVIGALCPLVAALFSERSRESQRLLWYLGVGLAGLALGVRAQAAALVGPILALGFFRLRALRLQTIAIFAAACAVWMVPTVVASGGASRLLARQAQVIGEAWPSEPLVSGAGWLRVYVGAVDTLVSPWGSTWLAGPILLAAAASLILLWRDQRRSLGILLLLFGPYTVYHYLLQETSLRYTIPILPVVAVPAAVALVRVVRHRTLGVIGIAAAFLATSTGLTRPALAAYAGGASPPAGAVQYLLHLAGSEPKLIVAGDFVFERYLSPLASSIRIIRTRSKEEWRALNRFWVAGEPGSIWFLQDPSRTILRLQDPLTQTHIAEWHWPPVLMRLIKGARPTRAELVRLDPPRWFAESGFALAAEAGHPAKVSHEKHLLFVRADLPPRELVVSGISSRRVRVKVVAGDQAQGEWIVDNSFSVLVAVPPDPARGTYVPVRFEAGAPLLLTNVAVTAAGQEPVLQAAGFYELERDERDQEFRWIGPHADVILPGSGVPMRVSLHGRAPDHYAMPLTLRVEAPGWQGGTYQVNERDFVLHLDMPVVDRGSTMRVTFWAGQSFIPDEVEHNGDRRSLALRVYDLHADAAH